ncbi:methenyltetrahydrofolate cyclohydrolase [Caloranaerobacter azorensis H53214]|uniref:Methenyltetrahydrofolate cyclohydrolase n=1 Tax=Caloranaerobacter azorensis H53214 TaxID=1156417 RepID=A0A096CVD6_9FIRM|nr:cyclodeaminase/cyclohydrolase family protein [Caloranaerobacter azorensis]KGG80494.1 methenyltetrahydrofolate cyclohydrolase [Caloranaerobacter azorensis H53214]
MLQDLNLKEFLEKTASKSPVPGGGSVAALSASLSASLIEMVGNLTIGKKGYEDVEDEMKEIVSICSKYREKFVNDIDRDSDAFNKVMAAFKLPKDTEEEKAARKEAIQESFKTAALVPLEVAEDAFKLLEFAAKVVEKGNKNAVTDGAVAAMIARTAVLSALYNVKINLGSIKDEEFVSKVLKQVESLESQVNNIEKEILSKVKL